MNGEGGGCGGDDNGGGGGEYVIMKNQPQTQTALIHY